MKNPKFQVFRGEDDHQYYYRLKARNGEIILNSEGYINKQSCLNAITSVKQNSQFDNRYDRKTSAIDEFYFVLKAANGEVIGNSEMYTSAEARENGIKAVVSNVPEAHVDDLTIV